MSIFIKNFETEVQYTAAESGLILPNVSLVTENNTVYYNSYVDPYAGHDYVEIGGLKWATMNIGAESVTDYGLHFAWGDTQGYTAAQVGSGEGQKYFGWEDYKYWTGDTGSGSSGMTKYNDTDGKTILSLLDDAARTNWGGIWRMPRTAEFQALYSAVNTAWTSDYKSTGIAGMVCTAKNGSGAELFFPAAGGCANGRVSSVGSGGDYWLSSLDTPYNTGGRYFYFNSATCNVSSNYRSYGYPVRGVVG